ncbi:MAG TPA: BMP family ABC transporter substrate-binding protein [Methanotrichaceae archaeon]|nr:BMP family ABC transporter substrate-binding protein [Methanotrichaceae archaeon]
MKRSLLVMAISLAALTFVLLAATLPASAEPANKTVKVINFINGQQGDKSFFDSAVRGVSRAEKDLGLDVKTVEAGWDRASWQPALLNATADGDYDILIAGTADMAGPIQNFSSQHPDKKFILYDAAVNYSECNCSNVYSVLYKQNEGSYLAGAYAGLMTKSGVIGVIGGMDTPAINDFIVGYEQGARFMRPDIKVIKRFAGSWNNTTIGKEIATDIYGQNADIIFQVAGGTGVGVFQAAQESGRYAIGVDSDQASIVEETNPDEAKVILTSMMKNVDNSLYRALGHYMAGKLNFGHAERLGIREGGVGIARNKYYEEATPAEVKAKVDQVEKDLIEGTIKVDSTSR